MFKVFGFSFVCHVTFLPYVRILKYCLVYPSRLPFVVSTSRFECSLLVNWWLNVIFNFSYLRNMVKVLRWVKTSVEFLKKISDFKNFTRFHKEGFLEWCTFVVHETYVTLQKNVGNWKIWVVLCWGKILIPDVFWNIIFQNSWPIEIWRWLPKAQIEYFDFYKLLKNYSH